MAWLGMARVPMARQTNKHSQAWRGEARLGMAWRGVVRQGKGANGLANQLFTGKVAGMIVNKYQTQVDRVLLLLQRYRKGDTIPWSLLESSMGMHRDERGGRTIIKRVRNRLLKDRQITAFPTTNMGLRMLTDMQAATEVPAMRQRRARRQITRGIRETEGVDLSQLTNHAACSLAMARKHMKEERAAIARGTQEASALLKPAKSVMSERS
jgi:hypothetical protein